MRKHLVTVLKLGVAVGVLAWLLGSGQLDLPRLVESAKHGWAWLIAANLIFATTITITICRWRMLTRVQGVALAWSDAIRLSFIGYFFNSFMPGAVGGDLIKAYYIASEQPARKTEAVTAVFVDRLAGITGMILVAGAAVLVNLDYLLGRSESRSLPWKLAGAFLVLAVGAAVVLSPSFRSWPLVRGLYRLLPLREKFKAAYEAVYLYRSHPGAAVAALLLSAVNHAVIALICYCLARAIGFQDVPLLRFWLAVPLGLLGNALSPTPNGWGGGEWAFIAAFAVVMGWPLDPQVAGFRNEPAGIAFLLHVLVMLWGQVGLVFYLRGRKEIARAMEAAERAASP